MVYDFYPPHFGVVTQEYSEEHPAIDIACREGDPIFAAHDGVLNYRWDFGGGHTVTMRQGEVKTLYAHLQVAAPAGWYDRGEVIGFCGNTGRYTTGPHLHFESNVDYVFGN